MSVMEDREIVPTEELLGIAEESGWQPRPLKSPWWKIGFDGAPRVYVSKAKANGESAEIHLSGFTLDEPEVEPPKEGRHLGRVQGILRPPRMSPDRCRQLFHMALDGLTHPAHGTAGSEQQKCEMWPASAEERLLGFLGYGVLAAPIWFIGLEEGYGRRLSGSWTVDQELAARAAWSDVMDQHVAACSLRDDYTKHARYSDVWLNVARLTRAIIAGASDWLDTVNARRYVAERLGRLDGETLLGELLPLPAISLKHWPYSVRWADRDDYVAEVWTGRRDMWSRMLAHHRPRFIICYGSRLRELAREIFSGAAATSVRGPRDTIEAIDLSPTRVMLTPFVGRGCKLETLQRIVEAAHA
jgi:hypothetical protein